MTLADSTAQPTPRFQEKREAILRAAVHAFNEKGVKGATLADIAARVGLVTNSVTYYYRKKEDLATACFLRGIEDFREIAEHAARAPDLAERVHAFFQRHVALHAQIARGEHAPQVSFNEMRALPSPHAEQVSEAYRGMFRAVRLLFSGSLAESLSRAELNTRTYSLLSQAHWLRVWVDRYDPVDHPRVARRVSQLLLNGLAADPAAWMDEAMAAPGTLKLGVPDTEASAADAFLRAATALVNEQGYHGASVDKISARLNVTKGSFYHHHDNKEELIWACFERCFSLMHQAVDLAEASPGDGGHRLAELAWGLAVFSLSAQGPLLRLSAASALSQPAHRLDAHRLTRRLVLRLSNLMVDGMEDGSLRPGDPYVAAQVCLGAVNATIGLPGWVRDVGAHNVGRWHVRPLFLGLGCSAAQEV